MLGELIPVGGGDPIPLLKKKLLVGRRESCDIVLRFPNVSAHHCQLHVDGGYWYVKDMNSRNGCKVNNQRVTEKRLDPGDTVSVAKHTYEVRYSPADLGAVGPPPNDDNVENIFGQSLLERAGLASGPSPSASREDRPPRRYDVHNDEAGQIKDPNRPL
ncbi:MAG: FHA domain-containing protein [Planctomycetales bacterium]|nr:FHA domain-containing protein [Planctomycetales bacterium]